jgi:hemerythrin-like domain-containing protein
MKRDPALVPLSREHHTALVLALRIEREVPEGDMETIASVYTDLIGFWARGLLPHFRAEGECLLARLIRHVPIDDPLISRLNRDHLAIEALVATIQDTDDLTVRRSALQEFAAELRTHVRWEEDVLFEKAQSTLTREELALLAQDVTERVGEGETGAEDVWPAMMKRNREPT